MYEHFLQLSSIFLNHQNSIGSCPLGSAPQPKHNSDCIPIPSVKSPLPHQGESSLPPSPPNPYSPNREKGQPPNPTRHLIAVPFPLARSKTTTSGQSD